MKALPPANPRSVAATVIKAIIDNGQSLDRELSRQIESYSWDGSNMAFCKELVFGVCRYYWELDDIATQLLSKPIRRKDRVVYYLILVGLYQIRLLQTAEHAAVSETVGACAKFKQRWAKGLVNAVLRRYIRELPEPVNEESGLNHPAWLVAELLHHWPDHALELMRENNQRAPMCLRVNTKVQSRAQYQSMLADCDIVADLDDQAIDGLILKTPVNVQDLPGFFDGTVSVQDTAAQLCADLLTLRNNDKVLDACAAPGGKSAHLLERSDNSVELTALEIDQQRCQSLQDTLNRLRLNARIVCMDARALSMTSDEVPEDGFNAILLDAPCSGTGVIRRHPDIKHHRTRQDIDNLVQLQKQILDACWSVLAPNGTLLYATCSVLPQENEQQIASFVKRCDSVTVKKITSISGISCQFGIQSLAGVHNKDGFYYCLLEKQTH
jgi:16S rRNA (cytosine967-C5)-methyltransferase